jgi:hypothetical protein
MSEVNAFQDGTEPWRRNAAYTDASDKDHEGFNIDNAHLKERIMLESDKDAPQNMGRFDEVALETSDDKDYLDVPPPVEPPVDMLMFNRAQEAKLMQASGSWVDKGVKEPDDFGDHVVTLKSSPAWEPDAVKASNRGRSVSVSSSSSNSGEDEPDEEADYECSAGSKADAASKIPLSHLSKAADTEFQLEQQGEARESERINQLQAALLRKLTSIEDMELQKSNVAAAAAAARGRKGGAAEPMPVHNASNVIQPLMRRRLEDSLQRQAVERWVDSNAINPIRDIAIRLFRRYFRIQLSQLLFSMSGSVDKTDHMGRTPLSLASHHGNLEHVKDFVQAGADIMARDAEGKTALHHAAEGGRLAVVHFLLLQGACHTSRTSAGESVLDVANTQCQLLLLEWSHGDNQERIDLQRRQNHKLGEECCSVVSALERAIEKGLSPAFLSYRLRHANAKREEMAHYLNANQLAMVEAEYKEVQSAFGALVKLRSRAKTVEMLLLRNIRYAKEMRDPDRYALFRLSTPPRADPSPPHRPPQCDAALQHARDGQAAALAPQRAVPAWSDVRRVCQP